MSKHQKTNVMRILDRAGIAYQAHQYEHQTGDPVDGVSVAARTGEPEDQVFKTLVTVGASGQNYVFVIPVAAQLDLKKAAKSVGEKWVEMIPVSRIQALTGYVRGGCSPIGMKKQFPTVLDDSAKQHKTILVSGGRIGSQIELAPQQLEDLIQAKFGAIIQS